jgi:hypothetical protein
VAGRVYTMISEKDLVAMRKINGETFVKTTKKGVERSAKVLREFIAYGEIANMSKKQILVIDLLQKGQNQRLLNMTLNCKV